MMRFPVTERSQPNLAATRQHASTLEMTSIATTRPESSSPTQFLQQDSSILIVSNHSPTDQAIFSSSPLRPLACFSPSSWPFPKSEAVPEHDDEGIEIMDHNDGTARSDGFKPLDDSPSKSRSRTSFRFSRLLGLSSGDSSDTVDDSPVATADSVETEDENNTPLRSSTPLPGDRDQPPSSTSTKQGLFIASPRRHSSTAQGSSRPGGSESTVISSGLSTTAGRSSVDHGATFGASFAKNRDHTAPGRPSAVAKDSTSHDENHITTARRFATGDQPSADRGSGLGASFTTDGNYQPFRRSSNDTTVGSDSIAVSVRFPGSAGRPHISSSLTDVSSLYSARRPSHARHRSVTSEGNITGTAPTDRRKFATAKSSDDCHNITLERRPSTTHFNTASHEFRAFSEGRSTSVCLPSSHGGHTDSDIGLIANRNSTDNRGSLASRRYPVAGNDDDDFLAFHPVFRPVFRPVHWSADYTNRSDAHQAQHSANDEGTTGIPGSFKISRYSRADTSSTAARTGDTSATLTTAGCSLICRASETGRRTPTSRDFTPPSTFTAYQRSQEGNDFTIFGRPGASNTPNPMKNFGRSLIRPPSATGTKPNDRSHCNSPTANTEPIPDACHRTTRSSATRHVTGAAARSIALESSSTLNTNTGHYSTEWASSDRAITTAGSSRIPGPSTDDDQATCYGSTEANVIPMKRRYASNQSSSLTKHRSSATASSQLSQDIRPTTKTEPAGTITRCLTPRIPGASIQPAGKKSPDDQELFEAGSRSSDDGSEATASVATRILAPCRGVTGTSRTVDESSHVAAGQYRQALERLREEPEPPTPSRFGGCHAELRQALDSVAQVQGTEVTEEDRRYLSSDTSAPPGSSTIPLVDMTKTTGRSGGEISGREDLIASRLRAPTTTTSGSAASRPAQPTSPSPETKAGLSNLRRGPVVVRHGPLPLLARGKLATAAKTLDLFPTREIRALWPGIDRMRNLSLALLALTGSMLLSLVSSISVVLKGNADGVEVGNWLVVWATLSGAFFVSSGLGLAVAIWRYVEACRRAEDGEGWITAQHLERRPLPPTPSPPNPPPTAAFPSEAAEPVLSDHLDRAEDGRVETFISPAGEGESMPRADTQASILTVLCAAVSEGYSPLSEEQQAPRPPSVPSSLPATTGGQPSRLSPREAAVSDAVEKEEEDEEEVEMF